MPYGYGDHADNGWGGGWIVMLVMMLIFIALAVAVIWFLMGGSRRVGGTTAAQAPRLTAEQLLADRLARGEIDPDEYRARLTALREHSTGT